MNDKIIMSAPNNTPSTTSTTSTTPTTPTTTAQSLAQRAKVLDNINLHIHPHILPLRIKCHVDLGSALEKLMKFQEALAQFQLCLELVKIGMRGNSSNSNTKEDPVLISLKINALEGVLRTMEALGKSQGERSLVQKNLQKTKSQLTNVS